MAQDNLKKLLVWSIIGTGISSVTTQLLTIREFLTQFQGNEITIALVISCWLLISGLGSLAARFIRSHSLKVYVPLLFVVGIWPLFQLIMIRELRDVFFIYGASPGFYQILFYILVTVAPYCLITGFILPCSQRVLNNHGVSFTSGNLYVTDSVGDIAGGFLFSFILVYFLKPFAIIAATSAILLIIVLLLLYKYRKILFLSLTAMGIACFGFFCLNAGFEKGTLSRQYGEIVKYLESPYGRIVVSQEADQLTFWESGTPLYSDSNILESEEKIHYPLSQLVEVDNVLLISGGLGETLKEVAKHTPRHLDYVEMYIPQCAA
jgi:spermidine synthase